MLRTRRKHHKSKDWNFLHRNYIQIFFSTPPKNIFSSMIKNVFRKFSGIFGFSKGFLIKPLMDHKGFYKETLTKTPNDRKIQKIF